MTSFRNVKHIVPLIILLVIARMLTPYTPLAARIAERYLPRGTVRYTPRFLNTYLFPHRTMSPFKLDPAIFNATLYKQVTDVWFQDVKPNDEELDMSVVKRWFMADPDERNQFDGICRSNFAHALESIGPDAIPEPSAQPFIDEIKRVADSDTTGDGKEAAWTALSLVLLLDQMPRNIYRTNAGLKLVYGHYDKMSYGLVRHLLGPSPVIPRVDQHPQWRFSPAHPVWFYLPLTHSEDLEAHNVLAEIAAEKRKALAGMEGLEATKMFQEKGDESEKEHRETIERFGRYPHRNKALGRESTEEEKKFLKESGAAWAVEADE